MVLKAHELRGKSRQELAVFSIFILLICFWLSVSSPVNCGGSAPTQMMFPDSPEALSARTSYVETSFDTNILENDGPEVQSISSLW